MIHVGVFIDPVSRKIYIVAINAITIMNVGQRNWLSDCAQNGSDMKNLFQTATIVIHVTVFCMTNVYKKQK